LDIQASCLLKVFKQIFPENGYFSMLHPEAVFLLSDANHNNTENDLKDMGLKLADEVKKKIDSYCPGSSLGRLSFIGHSMGGIMIRAALPHLEKYKEKMGP
jgi:poly(3-hydroxyalkanoate) synthetase